MNHDKKLLVVACSSPVVVGLISSLIFKEIEITIVLIVVVAMLAIILFRMNSTNNALSNPIYREHIKQIQKLIRKQNKKLFSARLPISLVVGPLHCGKSGFLKENNINMLKNDEVADIDLGTWWQTKNELFLEIDTNDEFNTKQENDNFWQQLINAIQTRNFMCYDLKNIVITLPITAIHASNANNLSKVTENIQSLLKAATELSANSKINIVFTKCDKILGFQSFFYDLSKDERNNLLAIFKNSSNYNSSLATICKNNLPDMIKSMQQHVLKRLRQEHDPLRKFEIKDFPLQMEQIIEPTLSILKQLELITPKKVYGLYFCCNNISNDIVDFIHDDSQPKATTTQISILGGNEKIHGYFNSNIIEQINCLKVKVKYTKKDLSIMGVMGAICVTSIYFCHNIYSNYSVTNGITNKVQDLISNKNDKAKSSELDKLYLALEYMNKTEENNNTNELKEELQKNYDSVLEQQLKIDISEYLAKLIANKAEKNQNFYPELVKFKSMSGRKLSAQEQKFLTSALSNSQHTHIDQHMKNYANNHEFNLIISNETHDLIKEKIGNMTIAEKAMLLVTAEYKTKFNKEFDLHQSLTPEYFSNQFQQDIQSACNKMALGHEVDEANCNQQAKQYYTESYKDFWRGKAKINIKDQDKISTSSELLAYLEKFNSENETLIKNINEANKALLIAGDNDYISNNNNWLQIFSNKEIVSLLGEIQRLCHDNQPQAFYEEIFQQVKVPEKSIVARADKLSVTLGEEQKLWLLQIAHSFDKIANDQAYNYLNNIWQNTVIAYYKKKIADKFPLQQDSKNNIEFVDFEQFFGPTGILNTYLKLIEPIHRNKTLYDTLDQQNIASFNMLNKVIVNWFDKYQKPRLYMTLVPVELEHNAKKFSLEIGNKKIELSKDQEKSNEIIWPEYGDNLVTLEFENILGQSSIKNKNSPWSFLQLLNESEIQENIDKKEFIITFKLDSFRAKYQLILQNSFDLKSYGGIANFKINEKL